MGNNCCASERKKEVTEIKKVKTKLNTKKLSDAIKNTKISDLSTS